MGSRPASFTFSSHQGRVVVLVLIMVGVCFVQDLWSNVLRSHDQSDRCCLGNERYTTYGIPLLLNVCWCVDHWVHSHPDGRRHAAHRTRMGQRYISNSLILFIMPVLYHPLVAQVIHRRHSNVSTLCYTLSLRTLIFGDGADARCPLPVDKQYHHTLPTTSRST
ncbi:hypothetical protein HD554DRAFT_2058610 [Boletus coccyginus]|nr:hypothetical protein HD554DRAFT_2058610 [Boletus coccyginus]